MAALLEERGAVVTSADEVARDVVRPGSDGLAAVVAEFGDGILAPDGSLDRSALGRLVFSDDLRRARLEEILLPLIAAERGMNRDEALARIAVQATDEERRGVADVIVSNSGAIEDLSAEVDRLWSTRILEPGTIA